MLNTVAGEYVEPMMSVVVELKSRFKLDPHPRLKNPYTVIEKLKRDATRLSKMQDIAGIRVVADLDLVEQDRLIERIASHLSSNRSVRKYDLRTDPRFGYRAVHLVVVADDCPIEIQVRTRLQDAWANAMELISDKYGRFVRYEDPPPGEDEAEDADGPNLADIVRLLRQWAEIIMRMEDSERNIVRLRQWTEERGPEGDEEDQDVYLDALDIVRAHVETAIMQRVEVVNALHRLVALVTRVESNE